MTPPPDPVCRHAPRADCPVCKAVGRAIPVRAAAKPVAKAAKTTLRPLPCLHLGATVEHGGCRPCRDVRTCDLGRGNVRASAECQSCPDYDADAPTY